MPESSRFARFLSSAAAPGAILAFGLALRVLFFVGYANVDPWDDTLYLELAGHFRSGELVSTLTRAAGKLDDGTLTTPDAFIARRGAYVPVALAQELLGVSELSAALPSLLSSLGTILLTFHLASLLAGRSVALWAALFYCVVPLDLIFSTRVLAGTLQTFWIAAAVTASAHAARREGSRSRRLSLFALSGVSLFLAYATRMNGLVALPLVVLAAAPALRTQTSRREFLVSPATLLVLLAVESTLIQIYWGEPFLFAGLELRGARTIFLHNPEIVFRPTSWLAIHSSYLEGVPHHFFKLFFGTVNHYGGLKLFSVFAPLGALALLHAIWIRKHALLVAWLGGTFLYIQYGFRALELEGATGTLHYFLNAHRPRYLMMLLPPLSILIGVLADEIRRRAPRPFASTVFGLLIATALYHAGEARTFYRGSMAEVRAAARFLERAEPGPVFTDGWGFRQLKFFRGGHERELYLLGREDPPEGAWVVIGGGRGFDIPLEAIEATLPATRVALYRDPALAPPHWRIEFRAATRNEGALQPATELIVFRVQPPSQGFGEPRRSP